MTALCHSGEDSVPLVTPSSTISPLGTRENPIHCEGRGAQMKGAASTRLAPPPAGCPQCPPHPPVLGPQRREGWGGWTGWGGPPASPFFPPVGKVVLVTGAGLVLVTLLGVPPGMEGTVRRGGQTPPSVGC